MKRENQGRLYTKDNYENLVWVRRMVDNPKYNFHNKYFGTHNRRYYSY